MTSVIRDFRETDLPALQAIRASAFAPVFAGFRLALGARIADVALAGAEGEQETLLRDLCADGAHRILVAEAAGPVGFAAAIPSIHLYRAL